MAPVRIFKSLYPPVPALPLVNYYDFLLRRPDQDAWDFTVYIDALTDKRMGFRELVARTEAAAIALTELGIVSGNNEHVAVLSENSMVR